MIIDCNLL